MVNPLTILQCSAMPEGMKVATMANEVKRRLKLSSTELDQEESEEVLKTYMEELSAMGYSESWRTNVLRSAITGYTQVLKKVEDGTTQRN